MTTPTTRTRKPRLFHKILELAKEQGGTLAVDDPKLRDIMTQNGKDTMYRLPTQVSGIRRVEKLEVLAVRKGKKVVSYTFPVFLAGVPLGAQQWEIGDLRDMTVKRIVREATQATPAEADVMETTESGSGTGA
jgi:hypothetical protein